jgi:hypothetical protein
LRITASIFTIEGHVVLRRGFASVRLSHNADLIRPE